MLAVRHLVLALVLASCGGAAPDRPELPAREGEPPDGGQLPSDPCELARATERGCLEDLAGACDRDPSCARVCYPFTLKVQEPCADATPGPCAQLAAEVEGCFQQAEVDCAEEKSALQLCEHQAERICRPLAEDPPSTDPDVIAACNEATAACWKPRADWEACREDCLDRAADAARVCAGA